jgi:hypothetical protein
MLKEHWFLIGAAALAYYVWRRNRGYAGGTIPGVRNSMMPLHRVNAATLATRGFQYTIGRPGGCVCVDGCITPAVYVATSGGTGPFSQ